MPHRTWEFRIADIVEAINNILDYTDSMSYDNSDKQGGAFKRQRARDQYNLTKIQMLFIYIVIDSVTKSGKRF